MSQTERDAHRAEARAYLNEQRDEEWAPASWLVKSLAESCRRHRDQPSD